MDISDLEKKLGIEGMSADEQMAMVIALQKSAEEKSKQARDETIGKSAELVIQGLKKIKSDIETRFSELNTTIQSKVTSLQDGKDGRDGKDGKNGLDGKQGLQGVNGQNGRDGRDGVDGIDGISVTSARIDFDGSLIIGFSSGVELNVGEVVAPDLAERIKVITNGGGTSQSVLDTLASLQTQINALIPSQTGNSGKFLTTNGTSTSWATVSGGGGGLSYQGTWNASTNTPTLTSSSGTNGYYYVVSTSGSTNLNGITDWVTGDWAMYNGTVWQKIDQTNLVTSVAGKTGAVTLTYTDVSAIGSVTSTDGSVTVSTTSGVADLSVAVAASTTNVICQVRNTTGATLTKGTAVYISGATGQIPTISKALATSDATSAQTLGLMTADLANNTNGYVTVIGLITNMDTSAYTDGAQLYLSGTTAGTLTATKTYAPTHLVYVAVVEHAHPTQGKLFVKVQNGYEMDELHNVSAQSPTSGQTLIYNASTSLWEKANLTAGTGIGVSNGAGSITVSNSGVTSAVAGTGISVSGATGAVTISNTGVTSVTGTSPVVSSGGTTPAISLATAYGDTLNPYASKTANYVLAAPNGSAGVPTFRAVVAADIPTLNQNTTGTASNVTGTVAIANGGTGLTSFTANQIHYGSFSQSANLSFDGTTLTANNITSASATALTLKSAGTTAITVDTSQNVGIGTASPVVKLNVVGSNNANNAGVAGGSYGIRFENGVTYSLTGSAISGVDNTFTTSFQPLTVNGSQLGFATGATERMRIDSSGNVLVGTTSATFTYTGSSTATAKQVISTSGYDCLNLISTAANPGIDFSQPNSASTIYRYANITGVMTTTTAGSESGALTFATGNAGANSAERMRITSAGRVGIGVTAPNQNLDVAGSTRLTYNGGSNYVEFESANNYVGRNGSTGDVDFGVSGGQNINFIISSSTKARLNGNGEFLTGGTTDNGAYNLQCNGTAVWGAGAYVNGSDSRIKNDIAPLNSGLDVVAKLNPVTYKYKETWSKDQSTQTGFIAQELLEALEGKNYVNGIVQQSGEYLSVAYQNIIPILTKAIQEQQATINALTARIVALESK